jgi:hypothetical protein
MSSCPVAPATSVEFEYEADRVLEARFEKETYERVAMLEKLFAPYIDHPWPVREYLRPAPGRRVARLEALLALLETYLAQSFPGVAFPVPLPAPLRPPFSQMVGLHRRVLALEAQLLLLRAPLAPYAGQGVFPLQCWISHGVAVLLRRSARIASRKS